MKDLFRGTYSEVINIKNLLENSDIKTFIANELMANIEPWVVTSAGFNPVLLKVAEEDYEKAIEIINDYLSGKLSL